GRQPQHDRLRPGCHRPGRRHRSDLRRVHQRCRPSARGAGSPAVDRHPGLRARRGARDHRYRARVRAL
ncbi:MAG: ATP synthase F0 sector subunit c, partial [uncultured Nocardioidaceae bacterium]